MAPKYEFYLRSEMSFSFSSFCVTTYKIIRVSNKFDAFTKLYNVYITCFINSKSFYYLYALWPFKVWTIMAIYNIVYFVSYTEVYLFNISTSSVL